MKKDYRKYSETSNNEEVQLTIDDIEVTEEVVEAVAEAIVEEAQETDKTIEEVVEEIVEEATEEVVEETVEEVVEEILEEVVEETHDEIVDGELNGCTKLNVRAEASKDAAVVCIIDSNTSFTINLTASTEDFYKVHTCVNDVLYEGFCVKQFISIK